MHLSRSLQSRRWGPTVQYNRGNCRVVSCWSGRLRLLHLHMPQRADYRQLHATRRKTADPAVSGGRQRWRKTGTVSGGGAEHGLCRDTPSSGPQRRVLRVSKWPWILSSGNHVVIQTELPPLPQYNGEQQWKLVDFQPSVWNQCHHA